MLPPLFNRISLVSNQSLVERIRERQTLFHKFGPFDPLLDLLCVGEIHLRCECGM